MNRCLLNTILVTIILSGFRPALAAVEPRLAGTWSQVDGAGQTITFSIEPGGRYSKAINGGKVIESGRLHMVDGNWMTSTDTGLSEKGTFSITGGKLVLRGGSKGTTQWVQASASTAKQATARSATKAVKAEDVTRAIIPTAPTLPPPVAARPKFTSPGDSRNYRALSNNLNQIKMNSSQFNQMSQVARSFGHGNIRSGLSNLANLANQSNYAATTSSAGYAQAPASIPVANYNDAASGRGSLSAKIKAQQAQQMSALPAAKVVQASPNSDESFTYGSRTLENKAFGPPKVIRIQVGAPPI